MIRKAIIPIAGLGSRFLPATKCIPKEMLPLYDRPVVEYIVRELATSGVEEVIFIVPPEGSVTPQYFYHHDWLHDQLLKKGKKDLAQEMHDLSHLVKIATVVQNEPLGDGHAILQAEELVGKEDFFVFFGDEILDSALSAPQQLLNARQTDEIVLGAQRVSTEDVSRFGIVDKGESRGTSSFLIKGFVEKPQPSEAPSDLALLGKNLCTPDIFSALRQVEQEKKTGEIRLIDALILLEAQKNIIACSLEGDRFDVGNPRGLLEASIHFGGKMI